MPTDLRTNLQTRAAARKRAMDLLARREHGRAELLAKLQKAGFDADAAAAAVDRLHEDGLQDDRRFVELFIASRAGQGKGPLRIRAELAAKRVAGGLVDECLAEADTDWHLIAAAVRRRKFGRAVPADFAARARQMRFLQYRGFEQDQIDAAVSGPRDSA